ncbi:cellulose binding domain-containing protein [Streptomyces sp. NBC_01022]|uniref:cellulose binding domain-containing protein n=1 Tax=Streptomyces sp. NBC_01022 TaxID=2903723 RepID=UPI002DD7B3D5|nr:cellulose binding domain-containing protein [Streptomyces sp. NBC_01022]WRZ85166.1 cellulose-binding domain-containing protein [Streptomyces sp. NBC_01022]
MTYRLSNWGSGFNADVTIRNTGTTAFKGWQLRFLFPDAQKVDSAWNAVLSQEGSTVQAPNTSWTESIPAGGSLNFGLNGSPTSANSAPGAFALNDVPCTTG